MGNPRITKKGSLIDMTGQIFNRWTVNSRAEGFPNQEAHWNCTCTCGAVGVVKGQALRTSTSKSCGCIQEERNEAARVTLEEKKIRRAAKAKIKAQTPVRKLQKQAAQMRYVASEKSILAAFHRWAKKRKNKLEITDTELMKFREAPCGSCGKSIEGAGNSFLLIKPRGPIALHNMTPACGICKLIKPKAEFDPIAFAKTVLRRAWKKTPMASIAKQRARKGRGNYECAACKNLFKEKEVQLDHKEPVVDPTVGFIDLDTFTRRLLCDDTNLQYLCLDCHSKKTIAENSIRAYTKLKKGRQT